MKFWALSFSLPANPSRYRVAVWKRLKTLGAVYLQPAVAVIPQKESLFAAFSAIADDVRRFGGTSSLLTLEHVRKEEEADLVAAFQRQRTEEYRELVTAVKRMAVQLEWEKNNGETELGRYRREHAHFAAQLKTAVDHDFFGAEGRREAEDAVDIFGEMLPKVAEKASRKKAAAEKPAARPAPKKPVAPKKPAAKPASAPKETEESVKRDMPVFLF